MIQHNFDFYVNIYFFIHNKIAIVKNRSVYNLYFIKKIIEIMVNSKSVKNKINSVIKNIFEIMLFRLVVYVFKIFGIAPFAVEIKRNYNNLSVNINQSLKGSIYNFILSFYFVIVIFYFIYGDVYREAYKLEYIVTVFMLIGENVAMTVTVATFCLKQRKIVKILERLIFLERDFIDNYCDKKKLKDYKYKHVFICAPQMIMSFIIAIVKTIDYEGDLVEYIVYLIPKFIIGGLLMQFSLIVIFIEKRFRGINETFALLAAANNNLTDISISSLSLRKRGLDNYKLFAVKNKIVNLKKSYRSLYEITKSVTKFYSWLLVFAILNFSTVVAYNLYRLAIITIRQQLSTKLCFFVSIWCITYFGPLLTFTGYVSKISSEVCIQIKLSNFFSLTFFLFTFFLIADVKNWLYYILYYR